MRWLCIVIGGQRFAFATLSGFIRLLDILMIAFQHVWIDQDPVRYERR